MGRANKKSETNPVFYFNQHQEENSPSHLTKNDFGLILMTECHTEMFKKIGYDKIRIDGSHCLNSYNFQLCVLLIN